MMLGWARKVRYPRYGKAVLGVISERCIPPKVVSVKKRTRYPGISPPIGNLLVSHLHQSFSEDTSPQNGGYVVELIQHADLVALVAFAHRGVLATR